MKKTRLMLIVPAMLVFGCDDTTSKGSTDMAMKGPADIAMAPPVDMAMIPAAPKLGTQIDRMGRPAINTAATNPFDLMLPSGGKDATKDAYNKDSDPTKWVANWKNIIRVNIAIFDGADTVCGNQLAADMTKTDPTRYDTLATVLADDRLWINTKNTMCQLYLGVEANALGVPGTATQCGGRTLTESTIDETYTALVVGLGGFKMDGTFAVTAGVPKDPDGMQSMTFPFLASPN